MSTFTDRCLKYEIFEGFKNMERNSTDVIIEDKVYKISTDQDASYVRELAEYINEKMAGCSPHDTIPLLACVLSSCF